ncbi:MAG: hypothetical protein RXO43_02600 [Candidatus Micrarchaeota archaeon]
MDINLGSIIKAGLIMAFVLPMFALILGTAPTPPPILMQGSNINATELSTQMNNTSLYVQYQFLRSVSGLNSTLLSQNGSFYANPTIFQAFAFILQGFGTVMQDIVMIPYLDYVSMNFILTGMSYSLPAFLVGIFKVGIDLLYTYMLLSMLLMGVSAIEKYQMKSG